MHSIDGDGLDVQHDPIANQFLETLLL